jgi:hypothetical protein
MASLGLSAGIYALHPGILPAAAAFCAGTIVDADHLLDLWVYQRHRPQGEKLMHVFDNHTWVRSFLLLHGFEFVPLLALPIFLAEHPWPWIGLFSGYLLHLLMDIAGNRCFPMTYFLLYRLYRGFDARYCWWDSHPPGTPW